MTPRPPRPTLFPYTTLFRSDDRGRDRPHVGLEPRARRAEHALGPRAPDDQRDDREQERQHRENGEEDPVGDVLREARIEDRKSTRLNSSHQIISYAVFCLKK